MARIRSIREIGDLVQETREGLRRAVRSIEQIMAEPGSPARLGELAMRIQAVRTLLAEVLEELRALE